MESSLQFIAATGLIALVFAVVQFIVNQFRLSRATAETAELERRLLGERIGLLMEQRRLERERAESSWNGFRKFRIVEKQRECDDVCSFHLAPHDGKPLPLFQPGQHLTFQLTLPGQPRPVIRCYSLSERPGLPERYRVTIKRAKDGLVSNFFHDHVKVGDIVDVKAPGGQFCLDVARPTPVVLIAGGVGLTPLLSMLNALVAAGARREVWFFLGVGHGGEHLFREHLQAVAEKNPAVRLHVCYSHASEADRAAAAPAFQHAERVTIDLLKRVLPSNEFEFYVCGPPAMMSDLIAGLKAWGVPEKQISFEAFGAATVRKPALQTGSTTTHGFKIQFSRSAKAVAWHADAGCLLDFAERHDIAIPSGCRAGNCGTCLVAIKSGEVTYLREPGIPVEAGSCLTCVAVPKSALTLDA
ncbi:MAG: 2Fe-2S iron-sulfur cluster binding domain-containing protein [Verrucomicrobia bacterium]|nr:2Fe-2S iron-sulfur cluster binding domain-containing protein [Verrucomicrobiota bacterium]